MEQVDEVGLLHDLLPSGNEGRPQRIDLDQKRGLGVPPGDREQRLERGVRRLPGLSQFRREGCPARGPRAMTATPPTRSRCSHQVVQGVLEWPLLPSLAKRQARVGSIPSFLRLVPAVMTSSVV